MEDTMGYIELGPEDPGHWLPKDVWSRVARDAEDTRYTVRGDVAYGVTKVVGELVRRRLAPHVDRFIESTSHGPRMGGYPRLLVVHDMECPMKAGYALSLAGPNWFGGQVAGTSPHYVIGPDITIQTLHTYMIGYHVGPKANAITLGYEQCGYTSFKPADWKSVLGMQQMHRLADVLRMDAEAYDIPLRWATDQQIRDASERGIPGGLCRHQDISRVLHGTTHGDPGDNYPRDLLLTLIKNPNVLAPTPTPARDEEDGMNQETFNDLMDGYYDRRRKAGESTLTEMLNGWNELRSDVTTIMRQTTPVPTDGKG